MTTISIHTSNPGWLEHPNTFAHVGRRVGMQVLIQADLALSDDEYRVYADTTPIIRTTRIDEECGRRIRRAIEAYLSSAPGEEEKPAPAPPEYKATGGQLTLF